MILEDEVHEMGLTTDRLQIFIITYNRARYLRRTLTQLLAETSPVRNCEIVILDNHSTDETRNVAHEFASGRNITIITHPRNIGGNGNIVRAMELARPNSYVWTLGDDDFYDFANWAEVEQAMERGEKAICLARYILPDERKGDIAYKLVQATFITGMIVHSSIYTDTVVSEAHNAIHTLFPQLIPVISLVNHDEHLFVVDRPIVFNGDDGHEGKDVSYWERCLADLAVLTSSNMADWMVCNYCRTSGLEVERVGLCRRSIVPIQDDRQGKHQKGYPC